MKSPYKDHWRGALIFICVWINNRETGDLRRHRGAHYDVIVIIVPVSMKQLHFMARTNHMNIWQARIINREKRSKTQCILYWICKCIIYCTLTSWQYTKQPASVADTWWMPLGEMAFMRFCMIRWLYSCCLLITLPIYHHYTDLSEGIDLLNVCQIHSVSIVCLRLSQFSKFLFVKCMGLCVFSLAIYLKYDDCENTCTLYYYHHRKYLKKCIINSPILSLVIL